MILLGSASDFKIAEKALDILEQLKIPYDIRVASAHRTHEKVKQIVLESTLRGVEVFIGIAGLSADLPGNENCCQYDIVRWWEFQLMLKRAV